MTKEGCTKCLYFATQDYGYSNYTVEETLADCLLNKSKQMPCTFSYWGEAEKELNPCEAFEEAKENEQIRLDVDHENGSLLNYTTSDKLQLILRLKGVDINNQWETLIPYPE